MAAKKKIVAKPNDEHLRGVALGHAVTIGRDTGPDGGAAVVKAAESFLAFLKGEEPKT